MQPFTGLDRQLRSLLTPLHFGTMVVRQENDMREDLVQPFCRFPPICRMLSSKSTKSAESSQLLSEYTKKKAKVSKKRVVEKLSKHKHVSPIVPPCQFWCWHKDNKMGTVTLSYSTMQLSWHCTSICVGQRHVEVMKCSNRLLNPTIWCVHNQKWQPVRSVLPFNKLLCYFSIVLPFIFSIDLCTWSCPLICVHE